MSEDLAPGLDCIGNPPCDCEQCHRVYGVTQLRVDLARVTAGRDLLAEVVALRKVRDMANRMFEKAETSELWTELHLALDAAKGAA